jgi:hypothetical protein
VPLRDWFRAIFLHTQSGGISAARLSQVLSVTYKTAWLMGHKIRHAMSTMDSARKLKGLIRITPAKYGQAYNPTCFRHPQEHPVLIGAALLSNGQAKYVKIKQVMSENITNRTPGYIGVLKFLEEHAIRTAGEIVSDVGRPLGERSKMLAQLGKSAFHWLNATFRGIGPKHLQLYLDQYCFHENYRIGRLSIFDLGLSLCVKFAKITLRQLVERPSLAPVTAEYDRVMNMKRAARSRARKRVVS